MLGELQPLTIQLFLDMSHIDFTPSRAVQLSKKTKKDGGLVQ